MTGRRFHVVGHDAWGGDHPRSAAPRQSDQPIPEAGRVTMFSTLIVATDLEAGPDRAIRVASTLARPRPGAARGAVSRSA